MIEDRMADGGWRMGDPCGHMRFRTGYARGMTRLAVFLLILTVLVPVRGTAQTAKAKEKEKEAVPKAYLPPAGMCRIWVDNVPAARQPAPTNCATAIRNRPPNARVIFPAGKDGRSAQPKGAAPNLPRKDTSKRKPPA